MLGYSGPRQFGMMHELGGVRGGGRAAGGSLLSRAKGRALSCKAWEIHNVKDLYDANRRFNTPIERHGPRPLTRVRSRLSSAVAPLLLLHRAEGHRQMGCKCVALAAEDPPAASEGAEVNDGDGLSSLMTLKNAG
ncbi:unnamed protein product [Boreogadus saida]